MADTDLGTAKGKIVIDASDAKRGVDEANQSIDTLDAKANKSAKGGLLALSGALAAVGAAGAAGFGVAITKAANFEQTLSGVKAVSGATEKEMEKVRKKALQLGADTAFSASEAGQAMEELVKSGLSVEDVLNGAADATVALAAAGEVSLPEAATIAANAMNQFELAAEDLPRVADLIAGAANASAIDVGQFGLAMSQAGATANLIGLSFDDLAVSITAMGNAGIKGSDAGTSLKTFLANLQPVTQKQIDLFYDLGLTIDANRTAMNETGNTFFDAQGKIKPMEEIAGTLKTALEGMSDAQKTATLEALFGSDAIRAAAIIAGEGAEGFDALAASMGEVTAAEVAATRLDNFNGSVEQLKGSLETAAIQIGDMFLPALRNVADQGTVWVNKFSEMDEQTQKWAVGIAAGTVAGAGLIGTMGLVAHSMGPVIAGMGSVISSIVMFGSTLTKVIIGHPVIAAIALIAAGVYLAYQRFEAVRNIVDSVGLFFKDLGITIYNWWNETVWPILQDFGAFWEDEIQPKIEAFWNFLQPILQAIGDFFVTNIVPILEQFAETAGVVIEKVVGFFENLRANVTAIWDKIKGPIQEFWDWFDKNVISTASAFIDLLVAIFQRVVDFVTVILVPAFKVAFALLSPIVETAFVIIKGIIEGTLLVIKAIVEVVLGAIMLFWDHFGTHLWTAIEIAFNIVKGIIEVALGIIRGIIQFITGLITLDWDKMWEGIQTTVSAVWAGIQLVISSALAIIQLLIGVVISTIKFLWDLVWLGIQTTVETVWDAIKLAVSTAVEAVKTAVTSAMDALKSAWDTVWNSLKAVVQALWDFVKPILEKMIGAIEKAVELAGKVKDFVVGGSAAGAAETIKAREAARRLGELDELGHGAILYSPKAAIVGDVPEAVIPLFDRQRALQLMVASGLGQMFMDAYGTKIQPQPNAMTMPSAAPASSAPVLQGIPTSQVGVNIEHADFHDNTDIQSVMTLAEFQFQGSSF